MYQLFRYPLYIYIYHNSNETHYPPYIWIWHRIQEDEHWFFTKNQVAQEYRLITSCHIFWYHTFSNSEDTPGERFHYLSNVIEVRQMQKWLEEQIWKQNVSPQPRKIMSFQQVNGHPVHSIDANLHALMMMMVISLGTPVIALKRRVSFPTKWETIIIFLCKWFEKNQCKT